MALSCIAPCALVPISDLPVLAPLYLPGGTSSSSTPPFDTEFQARCDDVNGDGTLIRPYWVVMQWSSATGTFNSSATVLDNGAAYVPANPIACPAEIDYETVRLCFRDSIDPTVTYWRTDVINPRLATVIASLWQNETGAVIPTPAGPLIPCAENADRVYAMRTSGMQSGTYAVPAPTAPAMVRSVTLLVAGASSVQLDNGPDAGATFPPGSYTWSAPVAAPGMERGALAFLPQFTALAGSFMVNFVSG